MNNIEVRNLSKEYDGFLLDNVSFDVPAGAIVGLIGENGAGKTTTIKALFNIIGFKGDVKIFGKDSKVYEKEIKKDIGALFDDSFLSDYLNCKHINKIMKDFYETWDEKKYFDLLKQFDLPLNKLVKDFSSGMKMKVKIAVAMAHSPKLLILDEPTSGLDPVVRSEILDLFRKYIEEDESRSILLSTHITTDLEHISDYILFIDNGKIVLDVPTDELLEDYGVVKCSEEDFVKIKAEDYVSYKKGKYQYAVLIKNKNEFKRKYGITTIDKPSIDDIMLFYIRGEK